jgi:hypothetical protein
MPQFLNPSVLFLALIRAPEPKNILWHKPEEDEFEPIDGFKLAELPIGRLKKELVEALERVYHQFCESANDARSSSSGLSHSPDTSATSSVRSHFKFKDYCGRIRFLIAHLNNAVMPFSESMMCWCICQRNILELDAYVTWIQRVKPTWGQAHSWRTTSLRSVVGCVTDQPDLAESCFRVSFHSTDCIPIFAELILIFSLGFRYGLLENFLSFRA